MRYGEGQVRLVIIGGISPESRTCIWAGQSELPDTVKKPTVSGRQAMLIEQGKCDSRRRRFNLHVLSNDFCIQLNARIVFWGVFDLLQVIQSTILVDTIYG